jgi:hypothetical protein
LREGRDGANTVGLPFGFTGQRLGYFPRLEDVPLAVVHHIRGALHLSPELALAYDEPRTLYRHHRLIREHLKVTPYGKRALRVATAAITAAVRAMDNPADLINVAIEELGSPALLILLANWRHVRFFRRDWREKPVKT